MNRRVATWAGLLALAALALTRVPGFDVLSFYFAMPIAALLGMAAGGLAVTAVADARARGGTRAGAARVAVRAALVTSAIPLAVVTVSALHAGPCDYAYGLRFYLAGPLASAAFGAAVGYALALVLPGRRLAGALFPLAFVASFVPNLLDLYRSPAVFFHNPFLGYYPGPIYDDRIEVAAPYLAFRALCGAGAIAAVALALAWTRPDLSRRRRPGLPALAVGLAAAVAAGGIAAHAGDLGYRTTRADIERALPASAGDDLCTIRHAGTLDPAQVDRLLWDCGFQHRRVAAFFGLAPDGPIRVYLYPDADAKARLMGARHVEVSKPWLREIHVTAAAPGDPVLGHELAHVVAGRLASSFLAVPVRYGVVPDMAVVEGLAVAASFADDGPSRHEWALAMIEVGLPVDPVALFAPGEFLGAGAGTAYTIAGSIVAWVAEAYGVPAVQALARGAGFRAATGADLADLVPRWRAYLETSVGDRVDRALVDRAAGRFNDPGVLHRRCPTDVARALDAVDCAYRAGDPVAALASLRVARALDPGSRALARETARVAARVGDPDAPAEARALLAPIDPELPPTPADRVAAADAWMLGGEPGPAVVAEVRAALQDALARFARGPEARGVCARLMALDAPESVRAAVFSVLAGGLGPRPEGPLLEALSSCPGDGLVRYLLGRLDLGEGRYAAAASLLEDLSDRGWPSQPGEAPPGCAALFPGEVAKVAAVAAFWAGRPEAAARLIDRAVQSGPSQGESLLLDGYRARLSAVGATAAAWATAPDPEPPSP